jgi:glycosyltransferase involved in cell wall biosynthesis
MSARVSAIVAVRDGEAYLAEAIESILAQTRPAAEVVVVDDGSDDGSAAIAEGFGEPVVCLRRPPLGLSAALNAGVQRAGGEMLAFLDADDLWMERRLELQVAAFERDPRLDVVFGATEQFLSPELSERERERIGNRPGVSAGRLRGAMLARAEVFERVGEFDERWNVGETVDWLARADDVGVRSLMPPEVVLRRRLHDSHMTHDRLNHADYARVVAAARARRRSGDSK